MSYYERHVFFCSNQRSDGRQCCADSGSVQVHDYAKVRIRDLELSGPGKVRINTAGCLDRCTQGPVLVVYPDDVWYTFVDHEDIDEIIDEHLVSGRVVQRLLLPQEVARPL